MFPLTTLHRSAKLFVLVLMALQLSGPVLAQDPKAVMIGHAESTDSYDPARAYTPTTNIVLRAAYETLVTFPDKDATSIQPMLATAWDISPDGLTYTFKLRPDAVFASGNPVTADDVVFSFNRLKNVKSNPAFLADSIASLKAVDAQTVAITLTAVNPSFLALLPNIAFSVTDSKLIKQNGGTDALDAKDTDKAGSYLDVKSAGSGPYMLDSWQKQAQTVLVRNPNYKGNAPYFDRVTIKNMPDAVAQADALKAGTIDLALDLTADQIAAFKGKSDIGIFSGPGNIIHYLVMNDDPAIGGPLSDPKVQLAVRYALNYDGYKALWGGVTPGTNLVVGLPGAFGEDQAFKRDTVKAKQLLSEAGYSDGFSVNLDYPDVTFQGVDMNINAQKIQADLAEVGIKVKLNGGDFAIKRDEYRSGKDAFVYWYWGPDILDPADLLPFLPGGPVAANRAHWKSSLATSDMLKLAGTLSQGKPVSDPATLSMVGKMNFLGLINKAKVEIDQSKRLELYSQIQKYTQQYGPFAPFNQPAIQTAFRANLMGYVWHPQWLVDVALLKRDQ